MPHPALAWIITQDTSDLVELGRDLGVREAVEYLTELAAQHTGNYAEGITDANNNVEGACDLQDEYMERTEDVDPAKLGFDPAPLLAALTAFVDGAKTLGWSAAVEAARDYRDSDDAALPDPDDPDLDAEDVANQTAYANGAEHAARQLVTRFGADPDPGWSPAS